MIPSTDPRLIHRRTFFALGRTLSRLGPTTPLALAALSVWHAPQVSRNFSETDVACGCVGTGAGAVGWTTSVSPRVTVRSSPPEEPQPATSTTATTATATARLTSAAATDGGP